MNIVSSQVHLTRQDISAYTWSPEIPPLTGALFLNRGKAPKIPRTFPSYSPSFPKQHELRLYFDHVVATGT
jgi:hypothetical protein